MKFMDNPQLEELSNKMHYESDIMTIDVRVEHYSCKMIRNDRKLLNTCEDDDYEEISYTRRDLLPGTSTGELSPSPLSTDLFNERHYKQKTSELNPYRTHVEKIDGKEVLVADKKTICNLRTILRYFYNDDSYLKAPSTDFFYLDNLDEVVGEVKGRLHQAMGCELTRDMLEDFWFKQDDVINFSECEKYQYLPELYDAPEHYDTVWLLNYFFYNRKKNQVLFLSLHAIDAKADVTRSPDFFDYDIAYND